jgi:hypothetical protein
MPGRSAGHPRILTAQRIQFVDDRDKPGHDGGAWRDEASTHRDDQRYLTPSFFCRLVDDVVYWNTSFLSG